jgi:hypothetical protein
MTLEVVRAALGWCTLINWGLLLIWFLFLTLASDFVYNMHSKLFKLSREQFVAIHYGGMAAYKLAVLLFNLVPYLALRIVGS